jgi:ribosomal protein S12 methylthiotransferase accessory factor YcaO
MAHEKIGSGELIVLSDPSIFINSMQDVDEKYDNRKLIGNLVARQEPVLIDQINSRTTGTEGLSTILHVMKTTLSTEMLFIVVLLLIAAVAWKRKLV